MNEIEKTFLAGNFILVVFGGIFISRATSDEEFTQTPGREISDINYIARLSSPRDTWNSLSSLTGKYHSLIREDGYTSQNSEELEYLEIQISDCFDHRGKAPSHRRDIAMETAVYIREIVGRFSPMALEYLPNEDKARADIENIGARPFTRRYNQAGIDFAFPTQTLHLAGDDKHPFNIGIRNATAASRSDDANGTTDESDKKFSHSVPPGPIINQITGIPHSIKSAPLEGELEGDDPNPDEKG